MELELVDLGTFANDGTGDDLRTAFEKVNANFTSLDSSTVTGGVNLGAGVPIFSSKVDENLQFRTLVAGANTNITNNGNTVTISVSNIITSELSGDLDVKDFSIISTLNRDIRVSPGGTGKLVLDGANWPTSYGINGQVLRTNGSGQLSWSTIESSSTDWSFPDFDGTFNNPIQYLLDQVDLNFGPFIFTSFDTELNLDLGTF